MRCSPAIMKLNNVPRWRDDVTLKQQHDRIKQLFLDTLDASDATTREEAFTRLRTLLAVHETAEEMIVHPRVRRKITGGEAIVDARLAEEHDANEALQQIEKLDPG